MKVVLLSALLLAAASAHPDASPDGSFDVLSGGFGSKIHIRKVEDEEDPADHFFHRKFSGGAGVGVAARNEHSEEPSAEEEQRLEADLGTPSSLVPNYNRRMQLLRNRRQRQKQKVQSSQEVKKQKHADDDAADVATPQRASLGLNSQMLGTLGKHLLPDSSMKDIRADLDAMLFGEAARGKHEQGSDERKASTPGVPTTPEQFQPSTMRRTEQTRGETSTEPSTTSSSTTVIDGDRHLDDYDYKDYDVYNYDNHDESSEAEESDKEVVGLAEEGEADDASALTGASNETMVSQASELRPAYPFLPRRQQGHLRTKSAFPQRSRLNKNPYIPLRSKQPGHNQSLRNTINMLRAQNANNHGGKKLTGRKNFPEQSSVDPAFDSFLGSSDPFFASNFEDSMNNVGSEPGCDLYTESLCLETRTYPRDEILRVLNRNRRIGADLVADVVDQSADNLIDGVTSAQENKYTFSHYFGSEEDSASPIRRQDGGHRDFAQEGGFLCPSEIMYAKPKRGKTAQGVWKDIVNVKDYTQTLRMEKCLKPGGSCSYVSHHYKSQCSQVYNYHRLLSWNKERGLHMDIYKVPTCCSCHIMGYSYVYPPLKHSAGPQSPAYEAGFSPSLPESGFSDPPPEINPQEEFQNFMNTIQSFPSPGSPDFGGSQPGIAAALPSNKNSARVPAPGIVNNKLVQKKLPTQPNPPRQVNRPQLKRPRRPSAGTLKQLGLRLRGKQNPRKLIRPVLRSENIQPPIQIKKNGLYLKGDKNRPQGSVPRRKAPERPVVFKSNEPAHPQNKPSEPVPSAQISDAPPQQPSLQSEPTSEPRADELPSESPSVAATPSSGVESKSINYGYHPIIDFFHPYRWSAAAAAAA